MSKFDELSKKFIELSKEVGIQITVDDLKKYIEKNYSDNENNKMSDVELEMVAGGKSANDVRDDMEPVVNTLDWIKKIHVHCFTVDSKISTPNGDKVISEIKIGEEVFSLDAQNKKLSAKLQKFARLSMKKFTKSNFLTEKFGSRRQLNGFIAATTIMPARLTVKVNLQLPKTARLFRLQKLRRLAK